MNLYYEKVSIVNIMLEHKLEAHANFIELLIVRYHALVSENGKS